MNLWLDDIRPAPVGWVHARTAPEAIALLARNDVDQVSLDHDLGDDPGAGSGYQVAAWVEEQAALGNLGPLRWFIHSANPVGRGRMVAALNNADRFWNCEEIQS